MSNYSDKTSSCRVDFFKESSKWYTTEAVEWLTWKADELGAFEAFEEALRAAGIGYGGRLSGMTAVCLEPYHEHEFPMSVKI